MTSDVTPSLEAPAAPRATDLHRLASAGFLLALAGAFLFSWKPIFVKLLYAEGVDAGSQLMLRFGMALPFYAAIGLYALRDRRRRGAATDLGHRLVLWTAVVGIVGYYGAAYLDTLALARITAQFERLVLFTYPTMVAVLGYLFFGERLSRTFIGVVAITYAGLALVFLQDLRSLGDQVVTGTLLVLGSALSYAFYLLWSKAIIARMGSQLFTCLAMLAGSSALILQFVVTHSFADVPLTASVLWLSAGNALIATVVPSFLVAEAIARIGPASTSVVASTGPIMTSVMAILVLGEHFTLSHLLGMLLVIGGILLLSRDRQT